MTSRTRTPEAGEVWLSPCTFSFKEDGIALHPGGGRNECGDYLPGSITGFEERTVLAVVAIPGHQRRVIYRRHYRPDGHAHFGRRDLKMTSIGAFNSWCRGTARKGLTPAALVHASHIETALAAIRVAA